MTSDELINLEIKLLMDGVYQVYGYDFREYSEASLRRRLTQWLSGSGFTTFSLAQSQLLRDRNLFDTLLRGITVNVSEMFRDPAFFKAVREHVVPYLKTYPFVKIWHAGCATGEEAYSMAILLLEEGLKGRFRIYATDINAEVISKAQEGDLSAEGDATLYKKLSAGRGDRFIFRLLYGTLQPCYSIPIVAGEYRFCST